MIGLGMLGELRKHTIAVDIEITLHWVRCLYCKDRQQCPSIYTNMHLSDGNPHGNWEPQVQRPF